MGKNKMQRHLNAALAVGQMLGDEVLQNAEKTQAENQDAQLAEHEGLVEGVIWPWEQEWNACLTLAFAGTGADMLTNWEDIPRTMQQFVIANPTAPLEALLMQVKLKHKVVILPNEDPRRVSLAVSLFANLVAGRNQIVLQDLHWNAQAAEARAYANRTPQKLDLTDTPYELVGGPFDATSGLSKAALARVADA